MTDRTTHRSIASAAEIPTLIHLGMPKTATTFLQNELFADHSAITHLGKRQGNPHYQSPVIDHLVWCLRHPSHRLRGPIINEARQEIRQLREPSKRMVLSDEAFTYGGRENKLDQAEAIRNVFGDCQILLTIREPISFIETFYLQELRGYHYHRQVYGRLVKHFGEPPRCFGIDEWLSHSWSYKHRGAFDHLMTYETASVYAEVFGDENIIIKPYEALAQDTPGFVRRLSQDLGIDPDESLRICHNRPATKNERWLQAHVDRLKEFNRSLMLRWQYRYFKSTSQLRQFIGAAGPNAIKDSPRARVEIPEPWRQRVIEIGSEQNSRLAARWQLPLAEFGYAVDVIPIDSRTADSPPSLRYRRTA